MKCPNCKEKLQGKPKFCPYCGATTAEIKAQGLFSDPDCPVDEHADAEILKPEDFQEKSSIKDDTGMTFVERELRDERKNFEFAEYEKRDNRFDYFGTDDSRYFDSSRYDFGGSATVKNVQSGATNSKTPPNTYNPTVTVNQSVSAKPTTQELKKQYRQQQIEEKRKLAEQQKKKKSKSPAVKLIKIFIVVLIIAKIVSAIQDELYSYTSSISSSGSYSSQSADYEDVSEFCDELSSAFESYDLEGILALNYNYVDKQDNLTKFANLYTSLYGSEEKACEALFEELTGNDLDYFGIDDLSQMNITLDTRVFSSDSDKSKDYIFCNINVNMSSMPSKSISFYVIKENGYLYYSNEKGE
jgi:molecular chaperone GrpE (heat shock protein)